MPTSNHIRSKALPFMTGGLLGEFSFKPLAFDGIDHVFEEFSSSTFTKLNEREKNGRVCKVLLDCINKVTEPCFLFPEVVNFITRVEEKKVLERFNIGFFELWLNQFSELDDEANLRVRAKIVGKWIPREAYQLFFPIGMGRRYPGSHYVTAHGSPDLDTTIASFWGWIDAFGARVSDGMHIWNVPGGPPQSQIEISILFEALYGPSFFRAMAKNRTGLAITSVDLLSQKGFIKKHPQDLTFSVDHQRLNNAVVLVDKDGYFLGDWRNIDVEGVRIVIMTLHHCLRWLESHLLVTLISLFAKQDLRQVDIVKFINDTLHVRIRDLGPMDDFGQQQRIHLTDYLVKVLGVSKGIDAEFAEFAAALAHLGVREFQEFLQTLTLLEKSTLFNSDGLIIENRPQIFHALENIIKGLSQGLQSVRSYAEQLGVCFKIKSQVFGYLPQTISARAEVEEIRSKMGNYPYLTVTITGADGRSVPLGVIHASDLHKSVLGTVSLRDFNNREETKIPSYFEVISVIDHHKSALNTLSAPVAFISDAQSSNGLVADLNFQINDMYSSGGMDVKAIDAQIATLSKKMDTISSARMVRSLLGKKLAAQRSGGFFIDPKREFIEYLHFLYAILEDTDLLTKVTMRDVFTVAELLNRMKSLAEGQQVEIINFDDIPLGEGFVNRAAQRILQNHEMFSLYDKIYYSKELSIEKNLKLCAEGQPSNIFSDTKVQNGCVRIGQTKLFSKNFSVFSNGAARIRARWLDDANLFYQENTEVDLHLHMISTISGAKELHTGHNGDWQHQDELWMWIPETEPSIEHLKSFLNAFKACPQIINNKLEAVFLGSNTKELEKVFSESFLPVPKKHLPSTSQSKFPMAILYFKAGTINSRKAMISPYLPKLIS